MDMAGKRKLAGCASHVVPRCDICGMVFSRKHELDEHGIAMHNFSNEESALLRKADEGEKARRRTRGPYRKSHAA
ncbi:MAG: hypothetical protein AB1351_12790 [Thermoproteota archaeon]